MYLLIALVVMCFIGMTAAGNGYAAVEAIHNPLSVPAATSGLLQAVEAASLHAISQHPRVNLPIGIAQMLLGGLLMFVSFKALFWRHASASFALQVLAANAALVVVTYALREPVHAAAVQAIVAAKITPRPPSISVAQLDQVEWWGLRAGLALQLATLGLCAFALTRKTARAVLAPAPRSEGP
jgi:hypothetical protein